MKQMQADTARWTAIGEGTLEQGRYLVSDAKGRYCVVFYFSDGAWAMPINSRMEPEDIKLYIPIPEI